MGLFLEELSVGQRFVSRDYPVTAEAIKAFAAEFDPQPFHLDHAAAKAHIFGSLAASGWNTAALSMRLVVEALRGLPWGVVGGGGELQWPRPVRQGDQLRLLGVVLEDRADVRLRARTGPGDCIPSGHGGLLLLV